MRHIMLHAIGNGKSRYFISSEQLMPLGWLPRNIYLTFDDGYQSIYDFLLNTTKDICKRTTVFLVVDKIGKVNDWDDKNSPLVGNKLLDWQQIAILREHGVIFGSHSMTHSDLTKLKPAELDFELQESKRILEDKLDMEICKFAYPFGYWKPGIIDSVKKAGYKSAVTTSDCIWEGRGNPYRQRRIEIKGTDPDWLVRLKLSGVYDLKGLWELPMLLLEKIGWKTRR